MKMNRKAVPFDDENHGTVFLVLTILKQILIISKTRDRYNMGINSDMRLSEINEQE